MKPGTIAQTRLIRDPKRMPDMPSPRTTTSTIAAWAAGGAFVGFGFAYEFSKRTLEVVFGHAGTFTLTVSTILTTMAGGAVGALLGAATSRLREKASKILAVFIISILVGYIVAAAVRAQGGRLSEPELMFAAELGGQIVCVVRLQPAGYPALDFWLLDEDEAKPIVVLRAEGPISVRWHRLLSPRRCP